MLSAKCLFILRRCRDYDVICTSTSGGSLTNSISDDNTTSGSTSFSLTFTESDGVLPGTSYECAIKTTIDGITSAKSVPAVFTTPDGTGKYMYHTYFRNQLHNIYEEHLYF